MIPSIDLGPLTIQTFGLCVAIAFLCAGAVLMRRFRELGWDPDWAYEGTGAALVGGIVGARLWWALTDLSAVGDDPFGRIFGGSGLTWYGGAIGGTLAVWLWAKWRKLPLWDMAGAAVPALALGYALGRVGCQISGDGDYGIPSDVPWAMAYPEGVVPTTQEVHPTPIYETLWIGLVALMLWQLRDRIGPKRLVAIYLIASGIERFVVEFWRRNEAVDGTITLAQITAIVSILFGVAVVGMARGGGASRPAG
ncbi:MAG: prolipoprotein diacylglyceryl transferase [Solirubrobacteraceae bacterium]|nr:prolipoprotein diacylglyceryl transferase [Solirubrobacteraceae bacterium]